MEILLTLTYVAMCFAVFKIFRIPVNQWTLSTAALGGICGLSLLFITMAYNHPFSSNARIYYAVTPMLPAVRGRVMDVPVVANTPLKQGDVLFRIDPKPYQYVVDQKTAKLAESEQNVKELKASFDQASAATERAKAQYQLAQQDYARQSELFSKKVIAQVTLDTYSRNVETAKQSVAEAEAEKERARLTYSSQVGGVNTQVAQLQAELNDAQWDLDQTVVQAPADGFVTQVALRPGVYVVPAPFRPAMTFVNTDPKARTLGAAFQQNALQRVRAGDKAEIAFQSVPGRVFKGKVEIVLDAIAAGQMQSSGTLQDFGAPAGESRAMALIDIVDDVSPYQIPVGSAAEVAVYTDHFEELSLLRKILLRMKSWENYVFLEGH
ncbi:MAG TPA: HlyD family secretion protein [Xanthobacteraceae bacterium]|jgi:multidrug resistance efflux pump